MRFREFAGDDALDKFVTALRSEIGSADGKSLPLSWTAISSLAKSSGFEMMSDPRSAFDTFKKLWDTNPEAKQKLEPLVADFNERSINLNVPGAESGEEPTSTDDSEQAVAQMAASAADDQIDQNQNTPQI
jgi:hypothetical protein